MIHQPLIREGERGENKWRKATWDEALGYIAAKMIKIRDNHGPESMLLFNQVIGTGVRGLKDSFTCLECYGQELPR